MRAQLTFSQHGVEERKEHRNQYYISGYTGATTYDYKNPVCHPLLTTTKAVSQSPGQMRVSWLFRGDLLVVTSGQKTCPCMGCSRSPQHIGCPAG